VHEITVPGVLLYGMRILAGWLAVVLIPALPGQTPSPEQVRSRALDWAVALASRYQTFHEPVAGVYATAALAKTVCGVDRAAGAGLYQDALAGLSLLTPQRFTAARHVLPIASFTLLWKSVTGNADKCDPRLEQYFDVERARAKMQTERQNAMDTLRTALSRVDSDPDRAGQLAEAAMSASDPDHLDIGLLTQFLFQLRPKAADVSDDVFPVALDFVASAEWPSPALLMELGKFLFVSHRLFLIPDEYDNNDTFTVNNTSIANFQDIRSSTIPDEVVDYIEAALKVLTTKNTAEYDPLAAYALAFQLLPKARDLAPDQVDRLQEALVQLQSVNGAAATQVQSKLSASTGDPNSEDDATGRARVMAAVFQAMGTGRFSEAREVNKGNSDIVSRNQVASLIDFAESAAVASRKEVAWASTLANGLVPGVKRSMLYAGIAAASPARDEALGPFQLAMKDIEMLPPEQRMFTLAANAGAIFDADTDNGMMALGLLVDAANEAYTSPHKAVFDPKVLRHYDGKAALLTDSSLVLFNRRGLCEVVDTGQHRYDFALRVPGVGALRLASVMPLARGVDAARLEALIVGLRDETQMALTLNALAAARLGPAQ
jgi:hypothetical protein